MACKALLILSAFFSGLPLAAQTQLVSSRFFPADLEFRELKSVAKDIDIRAPGEQARLPRGPLMIEAGLRRYDARTYDLDSGGSLSIEIMTMADARGAYSLLSLLRTSDLQPGPPGDFRAADGNVLSFAAGSCFVRITGAADSSLSGRLAVSIANRIGSSAPRPPNIVGHVTAAGCQGGAVRYFWGPVALESFSTPVSGAVLKPAGDVEIVQAPCSRSGESGTLTLLNFATIPLAEDYFESGAIFPAEPGPGRRVYTRQTGTLVGILDGNFAPDVADKTLGSIRFDYSIKWIFEKNSRQNRTLWGVPMSILGTVVRSLVFTALLCLISIVVGIVLAGGRVFVRRRWGRSDEDYFIRLKINED